MQAFVLLALFAGAGSGFASPVAGRNFVNVIGDGAGGYNLSYKTDDAYKTEERHEDGSISGVYSYVDPDGNIQSFKYTTGKQGPSVIQSLVPSITGPPKETEYYVVPELINPVPVNRELQDAVITDIPTSDFVILLTKQLHYALPVVSLDRPAPAAKLLEQIRPGNDELFETYRYTLGH